MKGPNHEQNYIFNAISVLHFVWNTSPFITKSWKSSLTSNLPLFFPEWSFLIFWRTPITIFSFDSLKGRNRLGESLTGKRYYYVFLFESYMEVCRDQYRGEYTSNYSLFQCAFLSRFVPHDDSSQRRNKKMQSFVISQSASLLRFRVSEKDAKSKKIPFCGQTHSNFILLTQRQTCYSRLGASLIQQFIR